MTEVGAFGAGNLAGLNRELVELGLDSRDIITIEKVTGIQGMRFIVYYHKETIRKENPPCQTQWDFTL